MEKASRFQHWENIYTTKELHEVGWYQKTPTTSLELIRNLDLPRSANIIDIGGGDSYLAPILLSEGYSNITVLDLSVRAIERAKKRLGDDASKIKWIVSDIQDFKPNKKYDCWHDRAAFHFLIKRDEIEKYVRIASEAIKSNGNLIIGTFSLDGPKECSNLPIKQYSKELLKEVFKNNFDIKISQNPIHTTPGGLKQHFTFCGFKRRDENL